MGLDFAYLGDDGSPARSVPIGVTKHWAIVQAARSADFPLLLRMQDYYEDAEYAANEVDALLRELRRLEELLAEGDMKTLLAAMQDLCEEAMTQNMGIDTIAD